MAADMCLAQVQACAIRITDLEADGVPLPGAGHIITSDALVKLTVAAVYEEGTDIVDKNGCGEVCVNYKGPPSFRRGDVTIEVCTYDPWIMARLSSADVITSGAATGATSPPIGVVDSDGVSVEVWRKRINNGDLDVDFPYAWWVFPKLMNLRPGNVEMADGNPHPTYTAEAVENPNWFDGPLNDWPAASDRAWQWIPTTSIPTPTCGPTALIAS